MSGRPRIIGSEHPLVRILIEFHRTCTIEFIKDLNFRLGIQTMMAEQKWILFFSYILPELSTELTKIGHIFR